MNWIDLRSCQYSSLLRLALAIGFVAVAPAWLQAQTLFQQAKLSPNVQATTYFGQSVAVNNDTVLIGAPWEPVAGRDAQGVVYVFVRVGTNWVFQQKLFASDGATRAFFGGAVALSGDTAIVGRAPSLPSLSPDVARGSAYVFVRQGGTWIEQARLTPSDAAQRDHFGASVALSGSTALIAAAGKAAVYAFVRTGSTWVQQVKLVAPDVPPEAGFGGGGSESGIALEGDTAVISAPSATVGSNSDQGAVYVFTRNGSTWGLQAKLTASGGSAIQLFGHSVSFSSETLLVGCWGQVGTSVRVFVRQGGVWSEQLPLPNTANTTQQRVAVLGDRAIARVAYRPDPSAAISYFRLLYGRVGNTWNFLGELRASDGSPGDPPFTEGELGYDIALGGDVGILGAPSHGPQSRGAAYVFAIPGGGGGLFPPSSLSASVNGATVSLSWTPPPVGVSSYVIRAGSGPGLSNLADFDTQSPVPSFTTAAPPGTYYLRVHAKSGSTVSPPSNEVVVTVPSGCPLPAPPTALTHSVSGARVVLSWIAAAGATSHILEAGSASGFSDLFNANVGPAVPVVSDPTPAGQYFVRVRTVNACGTSPPSNEVMVTVPSGCPLPAPPTALTHSVSGARVVLNWIAAAGATSYILEAGSASGLSNLFNANVGPAPPVVSDPTPAGQYFVRVRAVNACGTSPASNEVIVPVGPS